MSDEDCATHLEALVKVVSERDLPGEALGAIRRGAHVLRTAPQMEKALDGLLDREEVANLPTQLLLTCDRALAAYREGK